MPQLNPNALTVKATLLLSSTLTVMAGATIAPSLPAMRAHFAAAENADYWVRLVLTVPALFIVIGAPLCGLIVDRWGRKPLLALAVLLYGFAGSSGFVLNTLGSILVGRALLGLGVAGIMTSATTLIADYYKGQARASFMGMQAAFMAFGGVLFLSLGGYLADLSWRVPFLIYVSAWIMLPLILVFLYEPPRELLQRWPLAGRRPSPSSDPTPTHPAIELQPWTASGRLLVLLYGIALVTQIIFYLIPVQLPFYLQTLTQAGARESGLAIAFATLFSAFASMVYGRIKTRLSFITVLVLALELLGIGYLNLGLVRSYGQVLLCLAVCGLGLGLLMPNLTVWLSTGTPDRLRGRALGGLTTFFFLGQFLSPVISQPITQQVGLDKTYSLAGLVLLLLGFVFISCRQQIAALVTPPQEEFMPP